MEIFHINCNYTGTTLHQLMAERLEGLGHKNTIFVPTYNKNLSVITPNSNVHVCECFHKWDRLFFDYKQAKILRAAQHLFDVRSFALIHAYTLFTDGNCAMALSKKYGIPYVVAIRNTDVNDFLRLMPHLRGRGVRIMRNAAAVFFLSEAYRDQVFAKYIPQKYREEILKKTHIIPNGIDDFWFTSSPSQTIAKELSNRTIRLIYAGRIDRNKNIPTTQAAMSILHQKGYEVTLTVVGKAIDQKELEKVKQDPFTTHIPAQPKEALLQLYRQHDIFVMPSFAESFGLVYAEAMSQGLPVIYTKGQGFDKQFDEGLVGFHVDSHSAVSVADAIISIHAQYAQMSKAAIKCAEKFRWDTLVSSYDKIYATGDNHK